MVSSQRFVAGARRVTRRRQEVLRELEHVLRRPMDRGPHEAASGRQQLHGRELAPHRSAIHEEPLDPERLCVQLELLHRLGLSQEVGRPVDRGRQRLLL